MKEQIYWKALEVIDLLAFDRSEDEVERTLEIFAGWRDWGTLAIWLQARADELEAQGRLEHAGLIRQIAAPETDQQALEVARASWRFAAN